MKNLLPLLAAVFLSGAFGCETAPSAGGGNAATKVDYGAYPDNYEQIVRSHFGAAECRLGKPFAGYVKAGPLMGGKVLEAGYFVEAWLKAKDQSSPERRLGVLVKNGEVLMQLSAKELDEVERAR
ncbi:MAG: hypothetical protein FJ398_23880 [Verrucomicrobia bacterium]|nr:hypothetical protein [Verrucomicrobiota bacterium]